MRSLALIFFIIPCFYACIPGKNHQAVISGQLKNASGKTIYFERITEHGDQPVDSTVAGRNGEFSMPNRAEELDYYLVRTDNKNVAYLVLHGGESVTISGDAKELEKTYDVEGSPDTKLLLRLKRFDAGLRDSLNRIYAGFRNENPFQKDSLGARLQAHYDTAVRQFAIQTVRANFNSLVSLSASQYLDKEKDMALMQQLADSLGETLPGNRYVGEFLRQVSDLKRLPVGSQAPEINLSTPDGKTVALSSLKGKVVVVDFWASWCGPCRKQMPEMVELYSAFRKKGLEIYGVSLDDNADAWKRAIEHDRMPWIQVSELKRWDSEVVITYGIQEIPNTVLIDQEGRIMAKGLEPRELKIKIQEMLGNS